jgi:outer membrane protein assembly factor BamB
MPPHTPGAPVLLALSLLLTLALLVALALPPAPPSPPPPAPAPEQSHAQPAPNEAFWDAARAGDLDAVRDFVLLHEVNVNSANPYGVTALSLAADKGHLPVVEFLLHHGADPARRDSFYKQTALAWAVYRGHAPVVRALARAGSPDRALLLPAAAASGRPDVVRALLSPGRPSQWALDSALAATPPGQTAVADLLREKGARPGASAPAVKVDPATLRSYAGTFRSDTGEEITLRAQGDQLTLTRPGKKPAPLRPLGTQQFRLADDPSSRLTFSAPQGKGPARELVVTRLITETIFQRHDPSAKAPPAPRDDPDPVTRPGNWPSFRGPSASGVADGQHPPLTWDARSGHNVRWKTPIPGLGLSCPVVWGDSLFVTSAVGKEKPRLRTGLYGDVEPIDDRTRHAFKLFCLDKRTGKLLWERTPHEGIPATKRHPKSSHANPTPATDGKHVVAFFGSEGLYCYDLGGKLLWKKDLGTLSAGWFYNPAYQWGFGSSPVIWRDRVFVQCDVGKNSFLAAFRLADGQQLWKAPRDEVPSWGTPTVVEGPKGAELVTNATRFARGYDPLTGKELWRIGPNSEITVPTPVYDEGLVFITSGYSPVQPIWAVRPGARGDLSLKVEESSSDSVAWSTRTGGPYMPTPIVYRGHLYTCSNNGLLACYDAKTGKQLYRARLGGAYTASPVAADGRLYLTSEEGLVRVVRAGPRYERLATNRVGEPALATPAVADGMLFVRTQGHVFGIGRPTKPDARARK